MEKKRDTKQDYNEKPLYLKEPKKHKRKKKKLRRLANMIYKYTLYIIILTKGEVKTDFKMYHKVYDIASSHILKIYKLMTTNRKLTSARN